MLKVMIVLWLGVCFSTAQAGSIVVNQLGYVPQGEKRAYWIEPQGANLELIAMATGKVAGQYVVSPAPALGDGRTLGMVDFSAFNGTGWYQLRASEGLSVPFAITSDVYLSLGQRLLHALYLQRSGMAVSDPATGMHRPPSHLGDGIVFRGDAVNPKDQALDMTGGWYDAGDFGKYVATTTITVARLLEAYRQLPSGYPSSPTSQLPALLEEAQYGLDWLLKTQRQDGAVYRKVSGAKWPAKIPPWQDTQPRYVYGVATPDTAKFSATMAFAARIYRPFAPELAKRYQAAAIKAWQYLDTQPEQFIDWQAEDDSGSGPYMANKFDTEASLDTDDDDRLWAAAELFFATQQPQYLDAFKARYQAQWVEIFEWKNPALMGVWHLILALDGEWQQRLVADLQQAAERYRKQGEQSAFAIANQRFIWGSNKMTAEAGILLAWADFTRKAPTARHLVQSQVDYLLGANAFNLSFVTGSGTYAVNNLHHLYQIATHMQLPGFLVGGPNEHAQANVAPKGKGMLSYVDSDKSYAVNEFAIDYNASLIGLLAVHQAYFRR